MPEGTAGLKWTHRCMVTSVERRVENLQKGLSNNKSHLRDGMGREGGDFLIGEFEI